MKRLLDFSLVILIFAVFLLAGCGYYGLEETKKYLNQMEARNEN